MAEQEIVVKLTLDSDLKQKLEAESKAIQGESTKLGTTFKSLGVAIAGAFTISKVIEFGKACVDAYDSSILASTKLKTALGYTSKALEEQAKALQKTTRFEDDSIISAQALLAMYGLSEAQIKTLTPVVLNYAAATGTDLSSAAEKVGKSIVSTTNILARDGIQISDSTSKSERLAEVMGKLEERYKGQAEAAGNVGAGSTIKLKNAFNDLMENVGQGITEFPLFTGAVKLANNVLGIAVNATSSASDEYKILADNIKQETLPAMIDLNIELAKTAAQAPTAGLALGAIPKFADPEAIKNLVASFKTVTAEADNTAVNIKKDVEKIRRAIAGDTE